MFHGNVVKMIAGMGAALCLWGCSEKASLNIVYYPSYWHSAMNYDRVALAPIGSISDPQLYGEFRNGIVQDLQTRIPMAFADYSLSELSDDDVMYHEVQVQANGLMLKAYMTDSFIDLAETICEREEPVYLRDENGHFVRDSEGRKVIDHYKNVKYRCSYWSARVSTHVSVVDVKTNVVMLQDEYTKVYESDPYETVSDRSVLREAVRAAASQIVFNALPTFERRTIDVEDTLQFSTESTYNKKKVDDEFPKSTSKIYAFISLPKAAKLNYFKLDVSASGSETPLKSYDFQWQEGNKRIYFEFDIYEIKAMAGNVSKLDFRLRYPNGKAVFKRTVTLK